MSKFLKKLLVYGGISVLGYFGIKRGLQVKDISKLSRALPEFLKNVVGEQPKLKINMTFSTVGISAGFSQEIIDKESSIEEIIQEYIEDFYPSLADIKINVSIYALGESKDENEENCECENCTCNDDQDEEKEECNCDNDCEESSEENIEEKNDENDEELNKEEN